MKAEYLNNGAFKITQDGEIVAIYNATTDQVDIRTVMTIQEHYAVLTMCMRCCSTYHNNNAVLC